MFNCSLNLEKFTKPLIFEQRGRWEAYRQFLWSHSIYLEASFSGLGSRICIRKSGFRNESTGSCLPTFPFCPLNSRFRCGFSILPCKHKISCWIQIITYDTVVGNCTDLVTFTEEALNGKLHFSCSVMNNESRSLGNWTDNLITFFTKNLFRTRKLQSIWYAAYLS